MESKEGLIEIKSVAELSHGAYLSLPEVIDIFLGGDFGDGVVLLLPRALHAEAAEVRQLSAQTL